MDLRAVFGEQRDGEAVHAKRNAAGVRNRAGLVAQTPSRSEVVEMAVEAYTRGGLLRRTHRNQQLEFQGLLELAYRHYLPGPTEEGVAGWRDTAR